jgi:hypothetical protein
MVKFIKSHALQQGTEITVFLEVLQLLSLQLLLPALAGDHPAEIGLSFSQQRMNEPRSLTNRTDLFPELRAIIF